MAKKINPALLEAADEAVKLNGETPPRRTRKVSPEATAARLAARKWAADAQAGILSAIRPLSKMDRMDVEITFSVGGANRIDLFDLGLSDFGDLFPKPSKSVKVTFNGDVIFETSMEVDDEPEGEDESEEVAGG